MGTTQKNIIRARQVKSNKGLVNKPDFKGGGKLPPLNDKSQRVKELLKKHKEKQENQNE